MVSRVSCRCVRTCRESIRVSARFIKRATDGFHMTRNVNGTAHQLSLHATGTAGDGIHLWLCLLPQAGWTASRFIREKLCTTLTQHFAAVKLRLRVKISRVEYGDQKGRRKSKPAHAPTGSGKAPTYAAHNLSEFRSIASRAFIPCYFALKNLASFQRESVRATPHAVAMRSSIVRGPGVIRESQDEPNNDWVVTTFWQVRPE